MTTIQIARAADVLREGVVVALQPHIGEIDRLKTGRNGIVAADDYLLEVGRQD